MLKIYVRCALRMDTFNWTTPSPKPFYSTLYYTCSMQNYTFNIQNLTLHTLLRTPHLHSLSTLHSRLHTSQSTLHTLYWIILPLHTPHFTVQTLDSTLYLSHSTLLNCQHLLDWHFIHTLPHSTLHTLCSTLHMIIRAPIKWKCFCASFGVQVLESALCSICIAVQSSSGKYFVEGW